MGWAHLKLTARDMAALGQLYLDDGRWQGEQVVPTAWVHDATTEQVQTNNLTTGYGYQWWVTTAGDHYAYAAIGYGGRLIEVVPDLHIVALFSTDVPETGATVDARSYTSIVSAMIRQVESKQLRRTQAQLPAAAIGHREWRRRTAPTRVSSSAKVWLAAWAG